MNTETMADYAAMVRCINELEAQNASLKSNLFLAEETIKGMGDDIDLWKERAEALFAVIVGADLMLYAQPTTADSDSFIDVYELADEVLNRMIDAHTEALKADTAH